MTSKELKTVWKVAKYFWISGFLFWLTETVVFLIIEGWHYKATNPIEIHCDKIAAQCLLFGLQLTIFISLYLLYNLIFDKKDNNA